MYILWYSLDEKEYKLQKVEDDDASCLSNEQDVIYKFDKKESAVAEKVLTNLNLALRNVA